MVISGVSLVRSIQPVLRLRDKQEQPTHQGIRKGKRKVSSPKPTKPALWSKAKSLAKQKFDVYPSAYANAWAAKWYKSKGGGWTGKDNRVKKA